MVKEVLIAAKIAQWELSDTWNLLGSWNPLPSGNGTGGGLEVIIDAKPQQVGGQPIGGAGDRERAICQIEVEPFGLGRPVRCEADFGTCACSPAGAGPGLRQVAGAVHVQAAIGKACGGEQQHIADGDAGAA